jgi:hypothetical protein
MSYELQTPTLDISKGKNIITLIKLWGSQIVAAIIITLVILLISSIGTGLGSLIVIPLFLTIFVGQLYMATLFEYWDGCYKKKDE